MSWDSTVDTIHRDDIKVVGQLDRSVNYVTIDYDAVERRAIGEIRRNVMRGMGITPCLCTLPGDVPCTECGAGL